MAVYPDDVSLELKIEELADSLLYLPFDSDCNDASGNGNTASTESGGIIFPAHITPQVGGGCVQLAEATTNLITNPSFEVDTSGWTFNQGGTGGSLTRDTSKSFVGDASLRIDRGTSWTQAYSATISLADGESITLQARVYADSADDVKITIRDTTNAVARASVSLSQAGVFEFLTCTWTNNTGGAVDVRAQLAIGSGGASQAWFDAIQFEKKAYPTPYCDGSLGDGHSWSGTAHNSTSSRTKTVLEYTCSDVFPTSDSPYTIAAWIYLLQDPAQVAPTSWYIAHIGGGTGYIRLYRRNDTTDIKFHTNDGTNNAVLAYDISGESSGWHHVVAVYDGTNGYLYFDGELKDSGASYFPTALPNELEVGHSYNSAQWDSYIDDFVVLDRALTDEEVQILYRDGGNGVAFEGVWNDIIEDVRVGEQITLRYGILGHGELMRQAGAGTLQFALKNDTTNSGGLEGYYSPGHANARSGFDLGKKVRLVIEEGSADYYKFVGRLTQITPVPGKKRERKTICIAQDWLYAASKHPVNLIDVQENIRSDEMVQIIVDNLDSAPESISLEQGQETFTYVADDFKDEKTMAMAALDRVTRSEFGFCYIKGNTNGGGELTFEDRHRRVTETTIQATIDDDDIFDMNVRRDIEEVFNRIIATAYPREVSSTNETLYSLYTPIEIPPNSSKTIRARYSDPNNRDVRLGGKDLLDPEGKNELVEQGSADDRGFESGVGSWYEYTNATGGSIAQSPAYAKRGTYSLKLTSGTDASAKYQARSSSISGFAQNDVVYYQAYVNVPDTWPVDVVVYLHERDSADGWLAAHELANLGSSTSGWVRIAGSVTLTNASVAKVKLFIGNTTAADFSSGAVSLYIDEVYIIHDSELNYEFSSSESGGGDKNADLEMIESSLGGNSAEFVINNLSDDMGYVTQLKVRGKAIRTYDPIEYRAEDSDSIESYFLRPMKMDLRYIADPFVAQDFATIALSRTKDPHTFVESVVVAGNKSQTLLDAVLSLEPGDRIDIAEEVSGIDAEHFINGVEMRLTKAAGGVVIYARYYPRVASLDQYWSLGVAGLGELGVATKLAF